MVPLDEVSSADQVVSSIASSLGVPESPGQSLLDLVINYLRPRKMLLLLDNFEQVVTAAGVLGQLITETDHVRLLVTSRERLRLSANAWSTCRRCKSPRLWPMPMCCGVPTASISSSTVLARLGVM